jgi:hypothetical protein
MLYLPAHIAFSEAFLAQVGDWRCIIAFAIHQCHDLLALPDELPCLLLCFCIIIHSSAFFGEIISLLCLN